MRQLTAIKFFSTNKSSNFFFVVLVKKKEKKKKEEVLTPDSRGDVYHFQLSACRHPAGIIVDAVKVGPQARPSPFQEPYPRYFLGPASKKNKILATSSKYMWRGKTKKENSKYVNELETTKYYSSRQSADLEAIILI